MMSRHALSPRSPQSFASSSSSPPPVLELRDYERTHDTSSPQRRTASAAFPGPATARTPRSVRVSVNENDYTRGSPRPGSRNSSKSTASATPTGVSAAASALQHITTGAARDELLALGRHARHLQRRLQDQLDAQSAGLMAGLALDGGRDSRGSSRTESRAESTSTSPQSQPSRSHTGQGYSTHAAARRTEAVYTHSPTQPTSLTAPALPTTRRAIHSTLLELADLKAREAATLSSALAPLDAFLANAQNLEQKRAGLASAIAQQDTSEARSRLDTLAREESTLQAQILELEESLADKRNQLRRVQGQRSRDSSERDAQLSSWRQAAADVDQRIRAEVLAGRGLPGREGPRASRSGSAHEDVWALPPARRTLDLVTDSVLSDRTGVAAHVDAASQEADACTVGAEVWLGTVEAVRAVERALRQEMKRMRETPWAPASPAKSSIPAGPLSSSPMKASTSQQQSPSRSKSTVASPRQSTAAILSSPPVPDQQVSPTHSILNTMDAAISQLSADVDLAAARGWNLLTVAIGAELAALREGRSVLGATLGEASDAVNTSAAEPTPNTTQLLDAMPAEAIEMHDLAAQKDPQDPQALQPHEVQNVQRAHVTAAQQQQQQQRQLLDMGDGDDDGPSLDLLVEAGE